MLNHVASKRNLVERYSQGERNFTGLDLEGVDLTKINLSNAILKNANLVSENVTCSSNAVA
jgi:uncharacterized protein YjbI with pentapeptide repeats